MTTDDTGAGTLKLVVATGDLGLTDAALRTIVHEGDLRAVGPAAWIAFTDLEPGAIRDRIAADAGPNATVFVVEFERWSAFGEAIDRAWLLRRGH